ncbi:MAG: PorV/PorQ family protein [Bacteroidetes bacterium]|nr:MAG: PorV/PorQ family protein [Bacteroidota bacterium]
MKHKYLRAAGIWLAVCCLWISQNSAPLLAGAKYAGEFIAIGVGGRALGLGSSYVALANDVTSAYWNPSGLSKIQFPQIALMHDERFAGLVNYDYAAIAAPFGANATVAFSAIRLGVDNIPNTQFAALDANGNLLPPDQVQPNPDFARIDPSRVTYFNAADWAFYLSYAKQQSEDFSLGANLKIIRRDQDAGSATGIGFDIGAQYQAAENVLLGASIQDVTTTLIAWNTGTNEFLTPTLKLGAAYIHTLGDFQLIPTAGADVRFEGREYAAQAHLGPASFDFHAGGEVAYQHIVALRFGYSELGSLNVGAGVKLPKIDIDYTFAKFDSENQLGNTHRVSLTFTLESEQFRRISE